MRTFAVGDRVSQPQYGAGTVTLSDARHTVIDFDHHGVRRFVTSMVTLEPTNEPAPAGKGGARGKRAPRKSTKAAASEPVPGSNRD